MKLDFQDRLFVFDFGFNPSIVKDIKSSLATAWWDSANKRWTASSFETDAVLDFATRHNFAITNEAREILGIGLTHSPENNSGYIEIVSGIAYIITDGFPGYDIIAAIKRIPGRRFDEDTKVWSVPVVTSSIPLIIDFAEIWGFKIQNPEAIEEQHKVLVDNIEQSSALDAELEVGGLGLDLLPFQKAGVAYAIKNIAPGKGIYIADEMGLGKTPQSLAVLQAKGAFPALVVVPKVVYLNWVREIDKWLPGRSVCLLGGKNITKSTREVVSSLGATIVGLEEEVPSSDIYIVNYDILAKWADPKGKRVGNGYTYASQGKLSTLPLKGLIFDEAHFLKERKSQRTKAATAIVNTSKAEVVLALSGTPIPNRPAELISVIKDILNRLPEVGGWNSIWHHHCQGWGGGAADLDGLNDKMRASFYVRRLKRDVLPELPPVRWVDVPVEMANPKHYQDVEDDLFNWYREKLENDDEFMSSLEGLSDELKESELDKAAVAETNRKAQAEMLVRINALRQVAAREKLSSVIEWIENLLSDSGDEKVIVFGIHRDINEQISEHFDAPLIYGGMTDGQRLEAEQEFQDNDSRRVLVASIDAAGVGLTLTAANNIVFVEIPWRPMDLDQAVARAYGRLSDIHGVTSYQVTSPNTIEDRILGLIAKKRDIIEQGADGSKSVVGDLLKQIAKDIRKKSK